MSATYRVILLPQAMEDLDRIVGYIELDSPTHAQQVLRRLRAAARSLDQLPRRYKVYRYRNQPDRAVHVMSVPPFLLYYRVDDALHEVRVLTIRHGRQRRPRGFE